MAGPTLSVHPERRDTAGSVRYEFDLRYSGNDRRHTIFYEFPRDLAPVSPDNFDGILCAIVLHAMAESRNVRLHGAVTSTFLLNLEEFQLAWSRWLPAKYRRVAIEADSIVDEPCVAKPRSIGAFSGGVDSSFTLLRHGAKSGSPSYALDIVLMVHGFDIPLSMPAGFRELVDSTASIRESSGVGLRTVATNSKELGLQSWEHSYGAQLAGCLHLFSAEYSNALVGSSDPYDALLLPWGSNPVTDPLLSGGALRIVHDGAGFSRTEKVALLSRHPATLRSLMVCWEGEHKGRNCGVCEKCIRTQLNFLAVGVANPPCFGAPLKLSLIEHVSIRNDSVLAEFRSIAEYAHSHNLDADWLRLLRKRVRQGTDKPSLRQRARRIPRRAGLVRKA